MSVPDRAAEARRRQELRETTARFLADEHERADRREAVADELAHAVGGMFAASPPR